MDGCGFEHLNNILACHLVLKLNLLKIVLFHSKVLKSWVAALQEWQIIAWILWDYNFTLIFMVFHFFSFGTTQAKFPPSQGDVGHAIIYFLIFLDAWICQKIWFMISCHHVIQWIILLSMWQISLLTIGNGCTV